jgi:hypothetical protein
LPDDESTGVPDAPGGGPPYPAFAAPRRAGYGYRSGRRGAAVPPALLDARRRRLGDFAMPATVILAGVLIVVAFGFIINRAMRSDDDQALPQPQPPALGAVSLPPDDSEIIPLPSPSASSPSPTPAASSKAPPARTTAPPPDNGSIRITRGSVAPLVDLSAEGRRDWVHWGEQSTFSLERDKDGGFAILEGSPVAPRFKHALSPQRFSWQGGSPVDHSDGTPTGIRTCGRGNGFTLSVPATRSSRTLRLYLGVLGGRGRLDAKLSTGGGTTSTRLEQRGNTLLTAVFTVTYRAPKDGRLNLNWVTEAAFNSDCGGVALQAATLR